ncbi:MAG: carbohydrate-binding domain-containing protein [Clostridia bacterium]|nr:carbohydrate-binding domain-containing protein [Clostridia bacterium]
MKHITLKRSILTALSLLLIFSVIFVSCKAKGKVELPESPDTIKASNIYTLSFTVGGQIYFSETHEAGDKISYPQDPTVAGYDFISWDAELPEVMPAEDLTLNAILQAKSYRLTFMLGGEVISSAEIPFGEKITPPDVSYDGEEYLFSGWTNLPDTMPFSDLTVSGYLYKISDATAIDLSSLSDGEVYTITVGGIYLISGSADNAQIVINAPDQNVTLLLASARLSYGGISAPISCIKGESLTITLMPDSESFISDSEGNLSHGAINVKSADLTINGVGKLTIDSYHEGIYNTKDTIIDGGEIFISSASHGICVKDSLTINGGSINVVSGGDAIKCKGDTDSSDLYVEKSGGFTINSGVLVLDASGDGIDAEYVFRQNGGSIVIDSESDGIKSGYSLYVSGGSTKIKASEDAVKSSLGLSANANGNVTLSGGKLFAEASWDGIQADGDVTVANLTEVNIISGGGSGGKALTDENGADISQKGIKADGSIKISGGSITADTLEASIKAGGEIIISGGSTNAKSGADVIKNDDESGKISVSGGILVLEALGDAIAAHESLTIVGGSINATTTGEVAPSGNGGFGGGFGGGRPSDYSTNSSSYASSKALKSDGDLRISGGSITTASTGHSVHSIGQCEISGGTLSLSSSSGKGIAAHGSITISDGASIIISKATEAIESKASITVNGGSIYLNASDDGFNTGGSVSSSNYAEHRITVNGGFIYAIGLGDVFDSNGDIIFSGGTTLIIGPANGGNSCIDSQYGIKYSGGTVIGVASSGSMWGEDVIGKIDGDYVYNTSCGSLADGGVIAFTSGSGEVICALSSPLYGSIGVVFMSDMISDVEDTVMILNADYEGAFNDCGYAIGGSVNGGSEVTLNSGAEAIGGNIGGGGMPGGNRPGGGGGGKPPRW